MTKRLELTRRRKRMSMAAADAAMAPSAEDGPAGGRSRVGRGGDERDEDGEEDVEKVQTAEDMVEHVRAALEEVLFGLLPRAVRCLFARRVRSGAPVFLFNNHYVVKPGGGRGGDAADDSFGWHTDAAEQLALCLTSEARSAEYTSFWCPLDACSESNGTLVVQPGFVQPTDTDRSRDITPPLTVQAMPGDVVAFSSRLWHASGRNRTNASRRVFYAQYSTDPLVNGSKDRTPISLAVPCD